MEASSLSTAMPLLQWALGLQGSQPHAHPPSTHSQPPLHVPGPHWIVQIWSELEQADPGVTLFGHASPLLRFPHAARTSRKHQGERLTYRSLATARTNVSTTPRVSAGKLGQYPRAGGPPRSCRRLTASASVTGPPTRPRRSPPTSSGRTRWSTRDERPRAERSERRSCHRDGATSEALGLVRLLLSVVVTPGGAMHSG
jgi:hypothetical protein